MKVPGNCSTSGEVTIGEESFASLAEYAAISFPRADQPGQWKRTFDLSNWGLIAARKDPQLVGGAVIAFDTPNVAMLEGRRDLAVLWDIRVAPDARGRGIGSALLAAAETWARARGCRQLKVETQDVNVGACRFYERHGFTLRATNRNIYPDHPHERQMLFYKDLT